MYHGVEYQDSDKRAVTPCSLAGTWKWRQWTSVKRWYLYLLHGVVHITEGNSSNIFDSDLNIFLFNLLNHLYVQSLCSTNVSKSTACFGTFQVSSSRSPHSCRPNRSWAGLNPCLGFEIVSGWPLVSSEDCRAATGSLHVEQWNILSGVLNFLFWIFVCFKLILARACVCVCVCVYIYIYIYAYASVCLRNEPVRGPYGGNSLMVAPAVCRNLRTFVEHTECM
jgi:hypothetical protein